MNETRATFGRKASDADRPTSMKFVVAEQKSGRGWKDYAFYGVVGVILASVLGSISVIMEDPEERNARLVAEAKAEVARRNAAELAAVEAAEERRREEIAQRKAEELANRPPLKVHSFNCSREHGFAKVTGAVTNRSDQRIENLMVTAEFTTGGGDIVKTSDAMVDYQPLLPGQRSPFSTLTTDNPAIRSCNVSFKQMFGGQVRAER